MKILLGIALLFLFLACGKAKQDIVQSFNEPALMATWESKCHGSSPLNLSEKTFLHFSGSDFAKSQTFYSNPNCTEPAAEALYNGIFTLSNSTIAESGAKFIDFKFESAAITPLNQKGKDALDTTKLCGHANWSIGQKVDLTAESAGTTCPLRTSPSTSYEVYKVEKESKILYLSKVGWVSSRGIVASDRAKDLDTESAYTPSPHRF